MFDPNYKLGAERTILRIITECPEEIEQYHRLAEIYFKRGNLKGAWQTYMDALHIDPDDAFTCLYFGTFLSFCNDSDSALKLFEHARNLTPSLSIVHSCLGALYKKRKEFALANSAYQRAVEVAPNNDQAKTRLQEWNVFLAANPSITL